MADEQNDIKLISRKNLGFPDWLDFDKLRAEGIDYIGKLSGKIWTDHNVHDPGITTLEALCYALLDIGYRTNLPTKDILARDPDDKSPDDNFFTPVEILTVNPLTITDYRKLLIDIPGIRNAWLEVATDQQANDSCKEYKPSVAVPAAHSEILSSEHTPSREVDPCCVSYLNGLYHVYVDTEKDLNDETSVRNKVRECLTADIKKALMAHRNICEDFVDVVFLCKWKIGVCAEIELEDNADPEQVYLEMIDKLRQFLSPSPQFYTLAQMLDQGKNMDELFAGRYHGIKDSHGFVDTEELEKLQLRKSIHVSDVYNVLFSVEGIRRIKRLRLINCQNSAKKLHEWVVKIPAGNVPDFNVSCSGFSFNRRGIPVSFDFKKYEGLLEINFEHNGKILYSFPADKLDAVIPGGVFHKDLGKYNSIQNDFPRVYGIAEGGLPDNVPVPRKAQALQFKGYLLFFDHLLANYLSQLQHIRSLFPLRVSSGNDSKEKTTYFSALPGNVPDFQQLVRYKIDAASNEITGETGFLAFPVSRKYFQGLLDVNQEQNIKIDELPHYRFVSAAEKNIAVSQLQEDMLNDAFEIRYVTKPDECVYYYVVSSSEDFVLISRKYYRDEQKAMEAAASLKYAGIGQPNYRSSIVGNNDGFSFSVELNITAYAAFLQQITEDEKLYRQRRQGFLNHLLSRFAEKFTDYALLSYRFYDADTLQTKEAAAKSFYLSNYPLLSSTRGKGFDYTRDGWHSGNNSGFEKRIRGLLGHDELKRKSLCNFEVYDYGEKYNFQLNLSDALSVKTSGKFDSKEEAGIAAGKLFNALGLRSNYRIAASAYNEEVQIMVNYGYPEEARFNSLFRTVSDAGKAADYFYKMVAAPQANGDVSVMSYRHTISIRNADNIPVRQLNDSYSNGELAVTSAKKALTKINDPAVWGPVDKNIGKLLINTQNRERIWLIDESHFKFDDDNSTIGNPDVYKYKLLDEGNHFLFNSAGEFGNVKKAREAFTLAIKALADLDNLQVKQTEGEQKWCLVIQQNGETISQCSVTTDTRETAEKLKDQVRTIIRPHVYYLNPEQIPDTWKFDYKLGYETAKTALMESSQVYHSEADAQTALDDFSNEIGNYNIRKTANDWQLFSGDDTKAPVLLGHFPQTNDDEMKAGTQWLEVQREIISIKKAQENQNAFAGYVNVHEDTQCHYAYQLVDKDGLYAIHRNLYNNNYAARSGLSNVVTATHSLFNFLELQMSGNIASYREMGNNIKWYHYQLKSSNGIPDPFGGQPQTLVLFESVKGYKTQEEAAAAFIESYLEILSLACFIKNYGQGRPISETEIFNRVQDGCGNSEVLVFIPPDTLTFFGTYPQQSVLNLVDVILTYPVRSIRKEQQADDFRHRFLRCEEEKDELCRKGNRVKGCSTIEKPVYYFALFDKLARIMAWTDMDRWEDAWQSVKYYDNPVQAMKAFRFFVFLLKYPINYTVLADCDGGYRLFVREVVIESRHRFLAKKIAWGARGVQQLIGVSQQSCSFHAYTDENCCFRFFVACDNTRVYHPCKYDSPLIRDRVIKQLQYFLPAIQKWKFNFCNEKWDWILRDFENTDLCRITVKGNWNPENRLNGYLDLFSLIGSYPLCINEKEGLINLFQDKNLEINFYPVNEPIDLTVLKEKLQWLSCYFPFVKGTTNKENKVSYCIEIKLPGFNSCEQCDESASEGCPVAWMSNCCVYTCEELLANYGQIVGWLGNFRFYKPVFDCPCGSYGIELYDDSVKCIEQPAGTGYAGLSLPEIIGVSPMCYQSAETVCDAIVRAKKLINSEGSHLVEHILLRPHCLEDCDCLLTPCPVTRGKKRLDDCKFPYWISDDDNPCDSKKAVCFYPGEDPYSFIATVVLPAWPERFRNPANQVLLENMLYREMPAHVALRILWLTPHDMCCFESRLREWLLWTSYKKTRIDTGVPCKLVNFLFKREFECLSLEIPCKPCNNDEPDEQSCVDKLIIEEKSERKPGECNPKTWYEQLNELYCWPGRNCDGNFYQECEEPLQVTRPVPPAIPPAQNPGTPVILKEEKKQSRSQFINSRRTARKKLMESIIESSAEPELATKAKRFLDAATLPAATFSKLVTDLVSAPKPKSPARKKILATLVHAFLDQLIVEDDAGAFSEAQATIKLLRKKGYDLKQIGTTWLPEEMLKYFKPEHVKAAERLFKSSK